MLATTFRLIGLLLTSCLLATACSSNVVTVGDIEIDEAPTTATADSPVTPSPTTTTADSPVAPSPTPAAADGPCDLESDSTVGALGGSVVVDSREVPVVGVPSCQYQLASGAAVVVIAIPATLWAQQIPAAIEQFEQSGLLDDPQTAEKIEGARALITAGEADSPEGACALFSLMVELQGVEAGRTEVVNFVPTAAAPQAVNGQRCTEGRYTSVQLIARTLADDIGVYDRVVSALDVVHSASIPN